MTKPVILTVDDDREVLAAIERDLRQRYRDHYRIVASQSSTEALEAARELKRRGTPIALFVVDQRMPGMTGTEFLREARTLHPDAKRTLLTAYADSAAAIAAINEVGLDYYLMKPWDPPDRNLYPVLDDLLADWSARARTSFEGVQVIGSRWSPQSYDTRDFLSRNQIPYRWIDVEQDEAMRAIALGANGGDPSRLPVVLLADGTALVAPSHAELAAKVGLYAEPTRPYYDLAIIGAGPAGLACAVYGASEGLKVVLIEQNAPGGQAGTSSLIENYLGFPNGLSGDDLARRAVTQAKRFGAELLIGQAVVGIRRVDPYKVVHLANGAEVACHALMLSSGMSVRQLDVPGISQLIGAGVYYGAALSEAAMYRGQHVFVLGGANSAGQGALFFARYAAKVTPDRPQADAAARDVALPRGQDQGHTEHHRCGRFRDRRRARQRAPGGDRRPQRRDGRNQAPRGPRAVHLHRHAAADRGVLLAGCHGRAGLHPDRRRGARGREGLGARSRPADVRDQRARHLCGRRRAFQRESPHRGGSRRRLGRDLLDSSVPAQRVKRWARGHCRRCSIRSGPPLAS